MDRRSIPVAVVVLVVLLVAAQLSFTDVGLAYGRHFSEATTLESFPAGGADHVVDLAAAGGPDHGVVAWIDRHGDTYTVRTATVTVHGTAADHSAVRTVYTSTTPLDSIAVATDGDNTAIAVDRGTANDVVLLDLPSNGTRRFATGAIRTVEVSVAFVDGRPLVGWQEFRNGGMTVVTALAGSNGTGRVVGGPANGVGAPSVTSADGHVAVVWRNPDSLRAVAALGRVENGSLVADRSVDFGSAYPLGSFGGQGTVSMDAAASPAGVRAIWTDGGIVRTAVADWNGSVSDERTVDSGDRPRVAVRNGDWLAAWLTDSPTGGLDVAYRYTADGTSTAGAASRLPTDANYPTPLFAPSPALAWTERGSNSRVLVSAYSGRPGGDPVARFSTDASTFLFYGLIAAALAFVLTALMPWTVIAGLVAFFVTSNFFRRVLARFVTDEKDLRERRLPEPIPSVPYWGWIAAFVALDVALLVVLLPASVAATSIRFSNPLSISLLAALGTAAVVAVDRGESVWVPIVVFAYLQTALLWVVALPSVM